MKQQQRVIGLLAHVDAGKTTLSEGLLFQGGQLRRMGRVDHQDSFLDTDQLERARGITIFSKQALLPLPQGSLTLLDTPGHVDFSGEMERTLQVLDYALLVISGTHGIQAHTLTLWHLLEEYHIPTFLFFNKMDLSTLAPEELLERIQAKLSPDCLNFDPQLDQTALLEQISLCDEQALEEYLAQGTLSQERIASLIQRRLVFPCLFGSARTLAGVDHLLHLLSQFTCSPDYPQDFGARVFKVARDAQGNRLTYCKITGGTLHVKDLISYQPQGTQELPLQEKVHQIRLYSGESFQPVEQAEAGMICACTGLSQTYPGQGLGVEPHAPLPLLEPVFNYQVIPESGANPHTLLKFLQQLAQEDPLLHLIWKEELREIYISLMGPIQCEVLQAQLMERFGLSITFGPGQIVYKETIAAPTIGMAHYEPLHHFGEVQLFLQPGKADSGIQVDSQCPSHQLEHSWQQILLAHLAQGPHYGLLTGSLLTDVHITLLSGQAHPSHTVGGDFREAGFRAVRQGLHFTQMVLLEPWCSLQITLPSQQVGRALSDIQRMGGVLEVSQTQDGESVLLGSAPVSQIQSYPLELTSYTQGLGTLSATPCGYRPCLNPQEVVDALGYDGERDLAHPSDSIYCHGAGPGGLVKWYEIAQYMHPIHPPTSPEDTAAASAAASPAATSSGASRPTCSFEADQELLAIFERTYGPVKRREPFNQPSPSRHTTLPQHQDIAPAHTMGLEYLLVDGYNIIFAWEDLKEAARENLDYARQQLMDRLSNYQGVRGCQVILVFDAYRVPRGLQEIVHYHNIHVVYTKEAETADTYIEKATYELSKQSHRVRVATSDYTEQLIILGHGALRLSASDLREEMDHAAQSIHQTLQVQNRKLPSQSIKAAFERAQSLPKTKPPQV